MAWCLFSIQVLIFFELMKVITLYNIKYLVVKIAMIFLYKFFEQKKSSMQNNWIHFTVHLRDLKTILQMANVWFLPMWDPRIQEIEEHTQNYVSNLLLKLVKQNDLFTRFHKSKLPLTCTFLYFSKQVWSNPSARGQYWRRRKSF